MQGYVVRFRGHISRQTIKDVAFVGPGDCAVASGSDDGRMFIWDRYTGATTRALRLPDLPTYIAACLSVTITSVLSLPVSKTQSAHS
jgi:WD40 repeat protein